VAKRFRRFVSVTCSSARSFSNGRERLTAGQGGPATFGTPAACSDGLMSNTLAGVPTGMSTCAATAIERTGQVWSPPRLVAGKR
jgi:hypothetical protein